MKIQVRGIQYHIQIDESEQSHPIVVLLHGFLGSGEIFSELVSEIKQFCTPVTIDLLGHGQTSGAELHYRFSTNEQVADIVKIIQEQLHTPIFLYGYSMGARLALNIALRRPDLFQGLILESGSFGIEVEAERQARQALDARRADQIIGNFDAFLSHWETLELFKSDNHSSELRRIQSSQNPYWMANSLLGFGTGTMPCLKEELNKIIAPSLLFAGEKDTKFIRINQAMKKSIPYSDLVILPESGHRVHSTAYFEIAEHLKTFIEHHQL